MSIVSNVITLGDLVRICISGSSWRALNILKVPHELPWLSQSAGPARRTKGSCEALKALHHRTLKPSTVSPKIPYIRKPQPPKNPQHPKSPIHVEQFMYSKSTTAPLRTSYF